MEEMIDKFLVLLALFFINGIIFKEFYFFRFKR